jgi:hypothetical protein
MKRKGCLIALGVLGGVIAVIVLASVVVIPPYRDHVRNRWKVEALAKINHLASDTNWVQREIATLTAQPPGDDGTGWLSDHFILMKDGSWLVYDNICTKSDWRIADIFVGRASNGKWYYSTFHFCIGAIVLRFQGRPADLPTFQKDCYLAEFTGQPTERLRITWPESKRDR